MRSVPIRHSWSWADTLEYGIVFGGIGDGLHALVLELVVAIGMLVHPLAGFQLNTTEDFGVIAAPERLLHLVYAVNLGYGLNGGGPALVLLAPYEHATKVAIWRGTLKTSKRMAFHIPMRPFLGPKNFSCGK